jgi:hypothetical protein
MMLVEVVLCNGDACVGKSWQERSKQACRDSCGHHRCECTHMTATRQQPPTPHLVCTAPQHHRADLAHAAVLLQHDALGAANLLHSQLLGKTQLVGSRGLQLDQGGGACGQERQRDTK